MKVKILESHGTKLLLKGELSFFFISIFERMLLKKKIIIVRMPKQFYFTLRLTPSRTMEVCLFHLKAGA